MAFTDTWRALQTYLPKGATIPNWTAQSGAIGDPFTVAAVTATAIVVNPPAAETLQTVPREDFEAVYDRWNDYCHRAIQRSDFSPLTRYSKYIISILQWLEGHMGGQLP